MIYPTFEDLETRIRRESDLIDEPLVTQAEIMAYVNQAIDVAESEIHSLYEDYFLTKASINLVQGTQEYSLPSDIFATKIRAVIYSNAGETYELKRIVGKRLFERLLRTETYGQAELYRYILRNASAAGGIKLYLVPTSRETLSGALTVWYLRNANRVTTTTDQIDIPEFSSFIVAYAKWLIASNKPGLLDRDSQKEESTVQLQLMRESLQNRTPDDTTEVWMDMDTYEEHT